ncbi:MAG: DNA cytosine methyltransferase [Roseburia sp.]|nr:DNA cytosine methyltransferase [Roseburia sp.]
MLNQISFFDGTQPFRNNKPIRLIELFAGYGSQALALKYLGVPFEHYRISEWATKSIQAYKDIHAHSDATDYSDGKTYAEIKRWLSGKISFDYNTPATEKQIERLSETTARTLYNAMQATRNVGSITQATADDLAIERTDEFLYIMTYSFPCQDLSAAGNGAGMAKGSETRSGLLWEVERLLSECRELPQVLLMENVPQVIGGGAIADFVQWREFLESLGYKNYHKLMNAKDYGIPQNRNRCFMVSIRGDYYFTFPKPRELQYRLKDFLDRHVEEKYYLSDATIAMFEKHTAAQQAKGNGFKFEPTSGGGYAKTISTRAGARTDDNFIIEQGNEARADNDSRGDDLCERLQGLRQPSNECCSGNAGGDFGITIGKSAAFQRGPLPGISRTIDTQGTNGVILWTKQNANK